MNAFWNDVLHGRATHAQAKDTGMAIVLVLLLFAASRGTRAYLTAAIVVHIVTMAMPQIFRPAAVVWFGLSHVLGTVASRVVLSLVFFVVVTPMAVWRRLSGTDSLQLRAFRKGSGSVMFRRNHQFTAKDIERPY